MPTHYACHFGLHCGKIDTVSSPEFVSKCVIVAGGAVIFSYIFNRNRNRARRDNAVVNLQRIFVVDRIDNTVTRVLRYGERNSNGFSRADVFLVEGNRYGRKLVSLLPVGKQLRRKRPGQISVHRAVVYLFGNHVFQIIVFDRYVCLRHVQSARYRAVGGSNGVICRFQFIIENNVVTSRSRGRRRAFAGKPYGYYVGLNVTLYQTFNAVTEMRQIVFVTGGFIYSRRGKFNRQRFRIYGQRVK